MVYSVQAFDLYLSRFPDSVDLQNKKGDTALLLAAQQGHDDFIEVSHHERTWNTLTYAHGMMMIMMMLTMMLTYDAADDDANYNDDRNSLTMERT